MTRPLQFSLRSALLLVTAIAIASFLLHRRLSQFDVKAILLVRLPGCTMGIPPGENLWPEFSPNFPQWLQAQNEKIASSETIGKALSNPKVCRIPFFKNLHQPEQWVRKHFEITVPEDGQVVELTISGHAGQESPQDCVILLDAIVEQYLDLANRDSDYPRVEVVEPPTIVRSTPDLLVRTAH